MAARNIHQNEFHELLNAEKVILVDYWAPWCGYCRRIGPAYDKIAQQYGDRIEVVKVNIDEDPQLAHQQQIDVIPTLILYKDGRAIHSVVAPESKAAIDAFIENALR